jgi:hypothetical protein
MSKSDTDTDTDLDLDNSITNDINDLINNCHKLHATIIEANNLLDNIKDKIDMHNSITIMSDGVQSDFYELLELHHKDALSNIEAGRPNIFEDALLDAIDKLL